MAPGLTSPMTMKRIQREIADLQKEDLGSMLLAPTDDNLFLWKGRIPGPEGSIYEGGVFNLEVTLAPDYPFSAPRAVFKTRIYHMNISEHGNICIDILKQSWSPALSLFKVLLSLSSLLTDPNPKDPLVPSIATQYVRNRALHDSTARQWTEMYARPPKPTPVATSSALSSPRSSKTKGKRKADSVPAAGSTSSSRTTRASAAESPVIILDSDNEGRVSASHGKRKRSGRKSAEVVNLIDDDSDDDEDRSVSQASRGLKKSRTSASHRRAGVNSGSHGEQSDVIVIEDD